MRFLELRVPPLAVAVICALAAVAGSWLLPALALSNAGPPVIVGALFGVGGLVALLGVVAFRRAQTTVNPMRPQDSAHLVTGGIYRFTRNPMYLGFALMLLGLASWLSHILAFASVGLFVLYLGRFQIEPEERLLAAKFGPAFSAYARTVRRWI